MRIAINILSWNTRHCIAENVYSALAECDRVRRAGHACHVFCLDNGSSDGSGEVLSEIQASPLTLIWLPQNEGSSGGRNALIDEALNGFAASHFLMLDGDIEMVPGSTLGLLDTLTKSGSMTYCAGMKSYDQSKTRGNIAREFKHNGGVLTDWMDCAMTQYCLFHAQPFKDGVEFDERYGIGWGWEDNDLHYQMKARGLRCVVVPGNIYLHRNLHSSWDSLRASGVNLAAEYARRKELFLSKWGHHNTPEMAHYRTAVIAA